MSKDFPNRKDWLARRATPAKLPGRFVHISARLANVKLPNGNIQTVVARPGTTLNVGSKKRKRAAFAAKKVAKAKRRSLRNFYPVELREAA